MTAATRRVDTTAYGVDRVFSFQWKSIVAAALVGFAITLILSTLAAAIGLTAANAADGANGTAVGIGAALIWVVIVAIAGFVAGRVLATTAGSDPEYRPTIYGTLAWVVGVIVLLFLLANGLGNIIGGAGGGLGAAAATHADRGAISPTDSMRVAQTAADVGTGAAWSLLLSQLIGLGATIFGATRRGVRTARHEGETGLR